MENKKVTLQELADVISAQSGATKRFTDSFLRELVVVIQEYLEKDGVVKVKGLGTFKLLWIEARKSVNVATKETIILPAHYKLSFTPEEAIKQELNIAENIVSGGASVIKDAEDEVEPIESEVVEPVVVEKVVEEVSKEESATEPVVPAAPAATSVPASASENTAKKSHKALVSIIIILVLIILGLAAYIFVPNLEGKLMSLFTTLKQSNLEVVSVPSDSAVVEDSVVDTVEVAVESVPAEKPAEEPSVEAPVKDELPAEPMITVDNYTPSVAKNAPTREVVTVIDGSRLTMVAYRAYGHKAFWVYVYDANRDRLKRPSDVEKGMQLRIPDLPKSLDNSKDQRCLDKAYELARKYDK